MSQFLRFLISGTASRVYKQVLDSIKAVLTSGGFRNHSPSSILLRTFEKLRQTDKIIPKALSGLINTE